MNELTQPQLKQLTQIIIEKLLKESELNSGGQEIVINSKDLKQLYKFISRDVDKITTYGYTTEILISNKTEKPSAIWTNGKILVQYFLNTNNNFSYSFLIHFITLGYIKKYNKAKKIIIRKVSEKEYYLIDEDLWKDGKMKLDNTDEYPNVFSVLNDVSPKVYPVELDSKKIISAMKGKLTKWSKFIFEYYNGYLYYYLDETFDKIFYDNIKYQNVGECLENCFANQRIKVNGIEKDYKIKIDALNFKVFVKLIGNTIYYLPQNNQNTMIGYVKDKDKYGLFVCEKD